MLDFVRNNDDVLFRINFIVYFFNLVIILNKILDKVLFVNYFIYKFWGWIGGYNDGNFDFLDVLLEEVIEEIGVKIVRLLFYEFVVLDNILVYNYIKWGVYVGDYIYMNLIYLFIVDEDENLVIKVDENSGVKWFDLDDVLNYVIEECMIYIY